MDEPGFTLKDSHVCLVGLGLMGGSLALALRDHVAYLSGVDTGSAVKQAVMRGVVDEASHSPALAATANLVVLATPVQTLIKQVQDIGSCLQPGGVLIDVGSVKGPVVEAMNILPQHVGAVGGHPMCGKEVSGLGYADSELFRGAQFVLCRTDRTTPEAWAVAEQLVAALGAIPVEMEAAHHDRIAAAISHLPYVLSAGLVKIAGQQASSDPGIWALAASGFRDTSRLAGSDPQMMADILLANAPAVLEMIAQAQIQLDALAALIQSSEKHDLLAMLNTVQAYRREWESMQAQLS